MIDKFICKANKFIVFMIKRLTITIKTPFVDFSFAPMIVIALRYLHKPSESALHHTRGPRKVIDFLGRGVAVK